jgi:predicted transcriptional regulator
VSDKEGERLEGGGIILAIRPEFVEAIFAGRKRFELRRRRPGVDPGEVVYIYCTAPRQAIVGQFTCRGVHEASPEALWRRFGAFSSLSEDRFSAYFGGVDTGYALELEEVRRWAKPLALDAIRRMAPGFSPPQFHRRVSLDEPLVRWLTGRNATAERRESRRPGMAQLARSACN